MNMPLPKTTQGVYRLSVSTFYFLQGLVFASWASRIPDIKSALGLNDADLGSVLFAVPVGQMSAMALSGYLVGRCGSRKILMAASVFYPAVLVCLGMAGSFWDLAAGLFFFGVAANLTNISVNTQGVGVERLYRCSIMALGRFTADRLVMRFGPVRVLRASGILIASGLLVSGLFPMLWSATLGFLLVGFGTSSHCPALLQHGREIPENDSQHGAGFRLHHWLSGVPDGPSGHRAYRPCFLPPVVFLPDCPDWTGDGSYRSFTQKI